MRVTVQPLSSTFAANVLALTLLSIPLAPSTAQTQPPAQSSNEKVIPDQKLDAAAAALPYVANLQQKYEQQITAATAPSAKEQLTKEGSIAIVKAITKEGLSVNEFNAIIELAENDPGLREKLLRRAGPPIK
ncbi:MAG: DUF4168 domain-containing protein [Methylocystis silviterrae]|uniref:DUF4168 domain-containing protein n=1 Tax=Methylocystis silviterrae TaxID=2743612 RepID=UPI003C73D94F